MKVTTRFRSKAPIEIDDADRVTLKLDNGSAVELWITKDGGLRVHLDEPIHMRLVVFPHATNSVTLYAGREDEMPKCKL